MSGTRPTCSICSREAKPGKSHKILYDCPACSRCRHGFVILRGAAFIVDIAFYIPAGLLSSYVIYKISLLLRDERYGLAADMIMSMLILPLLFMLKDGFSGYSPGKRLFGVQVVDATTRDPIGFSQSLYRNLILVLQYLGVLFIACTMIKGPRWGDHFANTEVIWTKHKMKPPFGPRTWLCRGCGYNLTGNVSGRCPECFTPVPEADRETPAATMPDS